MTASGYWQLLLSRAVSWSFKLETLGHCFFCTDERQTAGAERPVSRVVRDDHLFALLCLSTSRIAFLLWSPIFRFDIVF